MKFHLLITPKMLKNSFPAFKLSDVFFMLRNVKCQQLLTFLSMIIPCSVVEHENAQLLSMKKYDLRSAHIFGHHIITSAQLTIVLLK